MVIISCDVDLSGQNAFGEVSQGVLGLHGYLIDANISTLDADQAESVDKLELKDKDSKCKRVWKQMSRTSGYQMYGVSL